MSDKGNCYDNPAVESFFKSLKAELVWRRARRDVEIALFGYINGFYNPGPVAYLCRPRCSFRPLGVRRPRGFFLPMLSADGAGYRSR